MRSKRRVFLILSLGFMASSCSGMFAVGHEDFACSASEQGGVCASIDYVYENREELYKNLNGKGVFRFPLNTDYELVVVGKGERRKLPMKECEKQCDPIDGCTEEDLKPCKEGVVVPRVFRVRATPEKEVKDVPAPVKEEDWVQRIWVEPYVDAEGNFVEGHFIYTVVKRGRWLLPEGKPAPEAEVR